MQFQNQNHVSTMVVVGGIASILLGAIGLGTAKFKRMALTIPFIILSLTIGLMLFMISGAILVSAANIEQSYEFVCNGPAYHDYSAIDGKEYISKTYHMVVDRWMCSDACPCDSNYEMTIMDNMNDTTLTKHQRNYNLAKFDTYDVDTMISSPYGTKIPLVFINKKTHSAIATYDTWKQCYKDVINPAISKLPKNNTFRMQVSNFTDQMADVFFENLEHTFSTCASLCETPLF